MVRVPANCPVCGKSLEQSGIVTTPEEKKLPVFQCDTCERDVEFMGERTRVKVTFCLDETGRAYDPASPDDVLD